MQGDKRTPDAGGPRPGERLEGDGDSGAGSSILHQRGELRHDQGADKKCRLLFRCRFTA